MRRGTFAAVLFGAALLGTFILGGQAASATAGTLTILVDTVLAEDHNGDIVIDADDVTLDCDGHSVTGSGSGIGIDLRNRTNVTLKNCDVSGFAVGAEVGLATDNTIVDNHFHHNSSDGVAVGEADGNTLLRNRSDNNGVFGFLFNDAHSNIVSDNSASGNGGPGFSFGDAGVSTSNIVSGNTASQNENGFALVGGSNNNTFSGNQATNNTSTGFDADVTTFANAFTQNLASGNTDGFHVVGVDTTFTGNQSNLNVNGFRDETIGGTGDAGTDNSYSDNICLRNTVASDPAGLCNTSGTFIDDDGNTFELAIEWLAAEGITKGCNPPTNTLYCPDDNVTRGQMAAFLVRALGYTDDGGGNIFSDTVGHTFEGAINKLATAGVTKGCNPPSNSLFCPDDFVTRGQMAAFLVRALGYTDDGGGDLFIDDDGHVFEAAIDKLGTAGVTKGCNPPTNTMFCPDDLVTRAQMAGFLKRALD